MRIESREGAPEERQDTDSLRPARPRPGTQPQTLAQNGKPAPIFSGPADSL